jgi:endonuclease/exonuclease/phosphatase family metal-dependent hydrolase
VTSRLRAGRLALAHAVAAMGIAALLLASSCRAAEPKAQQFTVMTYNLNWGMPEPAKTVKAIRNAKADIVCLQETTGEWAALFRRELKGLYPHSSYSPNQGPGGLGVLSKWPIQEIAWVPPAGYWFPACILKADTPIGPVQVLIVHLRPPLDDHGEAGLKPFIESQAIRRKEIEHFHGRLKAGLPTLALGDFNEDETGSAVKWLIGKGFADVLAKVDPQIPTWHGKLGGLDLVWRMDHILFSKDLACVGAQVLLEGGSDHYPLVARFEAPKSAEQGKPAKE